MSQCAAIKKDGTRCRAFALSESALCLFHTEKSVLAARIYRPPSWAINQRIRLLKRRLFALCRVKDEAVRARLTLEILSKLESLEAQQKALSAAEPPAPETTAEKLAAWEKSRA